MLSPGKDYLHVPKDVDQNVIYRLELYERSRNNPNFQRAIRHLCKHDILFYINSFVWQFNPNREGEEGGPFVTWDFQDDAVMQILAAIHDRKDLLIEKSREMGASWLCLIVMLWLWLFHPRKKFLCISKSEEAVESEDPDSLFWKIDYILRYHPTWLLPKYRRRKRFFGNDDNLSSITGVASTGSAGVGGRATAAFIDEMTLIKDDHQVMHHTSDTTRCRIFNATHRGTDTAFYEKSVQPDVRKLKMHWTQHPLKCPGLYRYDPEGGKVEVLDKSFHYPIDFNYVMTDAPTGGPYPGIRSPWYDEECRRKGSMRAVAMDLDINPKGSVDQFFDPMLIQMLKRTFCTDPVWEGDISYERDSGVPERLVAVPGGPLRLWIRPNHNGGVPGRRYAAGCDLGAGVGTTPSCISIADAATGDKVAEYVDAHKKPHELAILAVALCRLFATEEGWGAKFCWERQGPGVPFGQVVEGLGYQNVYREAYEKTMPHEPPKKAGWFPNPDSKRALLEDYRAALSARLFMNRSELALDECLSFRYGKSGHIEHAEQENMEDPSKGRVNHGDRVIADALCYKMVKQFGLVERKKKEEATPVLDCRSVAGRRAMWEAHERSLSEW